MEHKWWTLELIFETYFEKTYNYVYRQVNDQEISEDITSIIWEKIYISFKNIQYLDTKHTNNYIFKITKNTLIDHYRKKKIKIESLDQMNDIYHFTDNIDPEIIIQKKENNRELHNLIEKLPSKQSLCLKMKYINWLKNKEIASELDLKENTVASIIKRWIEKLKSIY